MSPSAKILIVDDVPANLKALQVMLSSLNVDVIEASSGNEALTHSLRHHFALILLDVQMPEMSGYEVASILHDNPQTTNTPILFLTAAYKDEQHQILGYEAGAVDYISKPISDEILLPKVRFFLQLYEYQQKMEQALEDKKLANETLRKSNELLQKEIELRKSLEGQLVEAIHSAEVAAKSKSNFLATMSHEIRTPMNGVLGMAELLSKSSLKDDQREQVGVIINSGGLLLTIINDILDFSKLEAGHVELEKIPFNLEHAIHDAMTLLSVQARGKDLELILDYSPAMPRHFEGDPARIRQILNNLIGNAIKFTEQGHVRVVLKTELQDDKRVLITLSVDDTGIGISENYIGDLFSSFTQADSSTTREFGGTGLGLSICKQIVEVMGGKIWAESVVDVGSTFLIEISLNSVEAPDRFVEKELAGTRVLLVDDNEVNRQLYDKQLRYFGIDAHVIEDPLDVVSVMDEAHDNQEGFDIVILDHNMPFRSGLELGKEIRQLTKFDQVKLMILTSSVMRGDAKFFSDAGFDAYLTKPALSGVFNDTLVSVLQNREGRNSPLVTRHSVAESQQELSPTFEGTVLLVEDNRVNQLVAKTMLENAGLKIDLAENGQLAVDMYRENKYDVIFMDCRMPVLDGYQATLAIRQMETGQRTPIIALTANVLSEDSEKCFKVGMDDFLTKPFNSSQLEKALSKWLS